MIRNKRALIAKERQKGIKKIGKQEEEQKLNFLIARRKFSLSIFVKHRDTFFLCCFPPKYQITVE
jgi:hypothetical protein